MFKIFWVCLLFCFHVNGQLFVHFDDALWETRKAMKKNNLQTIGVIGLRSFNVKQIDLTLVITQDRKSQKWGLISNLESAKYRKCRYIVQPTYDSIKEIKEGSSLLVFYKKNQFSLAYNLSSIREIEDFKQIQLKLFDEYKHVYYQNKDYIFVRKGLLWAIYDAHNPGKNLDFTSTHTDQLFKVLIGQEK